MAQATAEPANSSRSATSAANLERVYARSGATLPCYVDDGTAEAYFDVRTLPFELVMSDG